MTLEEQYALFVDKLNYERARVFAQETQLSSLKSSISSFEEELERTSIFIENASKCKIFLEHLMKSLSKEGIENLVKAVNQALSFVVTDRHLEFSVQVSDESKKAEFFIHDKDNNLVLPLENHGGGLNVFIAFVLNVYFLLKFNCRPFILLDESFTQISDEYLEKVFEFVSLLVKSFKFDILLVTHDARIKPFADNVYRVSKGRAKKE